MGIKFNLGLTEKKGVNYFNVEKMLFKGIVGKAHINITAHDEALQPTGEITLYALKVKIYASVRNVGHAQC